MVKLRKRSQRLQERELSVCKLVWEGMSPAEESFIQCLVPGLG